MKLANLVNLKPIQEMASMKARELADSYSLDELQFHLDQIYRDMEQEAEPEGGPIADQYADEIHAYEEAIRLAKGDSGGEMTYDQAIAKKYGKSPKGAGPGGPIFESTEKSWNAVDVSRTAEKEIDNKEWNERTAKKLAILKSLNAAGKFKKDWDEEKLQGWVDQNYSWEKLTRQFKLNELYSTMHEQGNTETATAYILGDPKQITIKSTGLHNPVTIGWKEPWGEESHTVDFEYEENLGGSEAYDECNTVIYSGESNIYSFSLEVCVDPNPNNEEIWDYDWNDLSIDKNPNAPKQGALPKVADMEEDFKLEPEDMDNPDEDLVIIGSGYLDIKSNFKERPPQTNGEYAALGQKVVDQLHNGDKEAALDYIYSKINEGTCGYGKDGKVDPKNTSKLTPGGLKSMPADKRTMTMMREAIRKEIKKLYEAKEEIQEEVFSDEELDYIGDMMTAMYEKLGLDKGQGETDVVKALALSDKIEGFFQSLK